MAVTLDSWFLSNLCQIPDLYAEIPAFYTEVTEFTILHFFQGKIKYAQSMLHGS